MDGLRASFIASEDILMQKKASKEQMINDIKYQYSTDWIHSLEAEEHWRLYWRQQELMQDRVLPGDRVLEIGVGSGFTANYLRSKGVNVKTLDIDSEKNPDIVSNMVVYDFQSEYDHVLAFEVFEHIPYNEFESVLNKLSKICRNFLFLSIPKSEVVLFRCELRFPKIKNKVISVTIPKRKITTKHHFWELNHKATPRSKFEASVRKAGFKIISRGVWLSRAFYVLRTTNSDEAS